MAAKKARRRRMGRPPGTGKPPEEVRTNRVVVMLTATELEKLEQIADEQGAPLGTTAYRILARTLKRRK